MGRTWIVSTASSYTLGVRISGLVLISGVAIASMLLAGGHDLIRTRMIVRGASAASKPAKGKKSSKRKGKT